MIVQLLPADSAMEINPLHELAHQQRVHPGNRPYVLTNMVSSADGAIAIDGQSGALGGPADFEVFMALRSVADIILAGAETVRAEKYKPPSPSAEVQEQRRARGQKARPTIAILTASANLDPDLPIFSEPDNRPIVLCGSAADTAALAKLDGLATILRAENDRLDPPVALGLLHGEGAATVLLEGGPSLNGQFISADCVDEWNLTIAPQLVAGDAGRTASGGGAVNHRFELGHLWRGDDLLFVQYLRPRQL